MDHLHWDYLDYVLTFRILHLSSDLQLESLEKSQEIYILIKHPVNYDVLKVETYWLQLKLWGSWDLALATSNSHILQFFSSSVLSDYNVKTMFHHLLTLIFKADSKSYL